jgi:heptosyltransferase-2
VTERILVVGPSWVGDMVMAQSLYISLQQRFQNALIDVIAPPWSLSIVARMKHVNRGIALPLSHGEFGFSTRRKLGRSLRDDRYTRAIVLPRSWKAALLPFFARIPQRTGYRGEMRMGLLNDIRVLDKSVLTMTVQRYVSLGLASESPQPPVIPNPRLTVDVDNQQRVIEALGLESEQKAVALMPGAEYGPAKQWPAKYFFSLAQMLVKRGFQVWVLGSEKEKRVGDDIANSQPNVYNLCGKTKLEDVIDLLAATRFAVSNDSGLMHVAAAVDIPIVAIYGSSSADFTPPLTDKKYILSRDLECSPCFERHCPLGHYRCLKELRPGHVLDTISSLMD